MNDTSSKKPYKKSLYNIVYIYQINIEFKIYRLVAIKRNPTQIKDIVKCIATYQP